MLCKIGQLEMEREFLKKLEEAGSVTERLGMVNREEPLSILCQCNLVSVSRGSFYYMPLDESEDNLKLMRLMDKHYLEHPIEGVNRIRDFLLTLSILANHKRVRRLLRLMGLMAIYPRKNLSRLGQAKYIRPYLLRDLKVVRPNQVWAIDITYIPLPRGFLYLTAIIDFHSRYVVGWGISYTLDGSCSPSVTKETIARHGKQEITNSDQGSQYTSFAWTNFLEKEGIRISMDGKGRATDNIWIARFWKSLKYNYIYLNPCDNGLELFEGVQNHIAYYNQKKHQSIKKTPNEAFKESITRKAA
ncbi:MAG TPA: IS3 family transposase [Bacteroidales bacterium]|nr:IS3 family transposase [Bacteroidales bacterium]